MLGAHGSRSPPRPSRVSGRPLPRWAPGPRVKVAAPAFVYVTRRSRLGRDARARRPQPQAGEGIRCRRQMGLAANLCTRTYAHTHTTIYMHIYTYTYTHIDR